jgi:type IV secretion system protein VirD4
MLHPKPKTKKMFRENIIDEYDKRPRAFELNRFLAKTGNFRALFFTVAFAGIFALNYAVRSLSGFSPSALLRGEAPGPGGIGDLLPTTGLIGLYIVYAVLAAVGYIILQLGMRIAHAEDNIGEKGTQRFATREEIKAQYKAVPLKGKPFKGGGGFPVAEDGKCVYIDDSPVNNLLIGITRSGKGETVIFKMIDIHSRAENKPSLIINDPKLELASACIPKLAERGYGYHILNLVDPDFSMMYNPLTAAAEEYKAGETDTALQLIASFCYAVFNSTEPTGADKYFQDTSTCTLTGLILALIHDQLEADRKITALKKAEYDLKYGDEPYKPEFEPCTENELRINMYSVVTLFISLATAQINDYKTELDVFFDARPPEDPARLMYYTAGIAGERQKGNVFSSTVAGLRVFLMPLIAKMTSESSVDMRTVGIAAKPTVVFLGLPDYDHSNYFLATSYINQLYFTLAKLATHSPGGKLPREVVFLIDEAGNIPPIDGLATKLTVCLGRNIRFNLVIQSYAQLAKLYGEDDSATITGNCGNQLYILSSDYDTCEAFSQKLGSRTITTVHRSGKKLAIRKDFTEMPEERRLIDANELMRFMPGESAVHRVMKRTTKEGEKIRPYPIYNTEPFPQKFRYEYMLDDFPANNVIYNSPSMRHAYELIDADRRAVYGEAAGIADMPESLTEKYGLEIETTKDIDFKARIWDKETYFEMAGNKFLPIREAATQAELARLHACFTGDVTESDLDAMLHGDDIRVADLIETAEVMLQSSYAPKKRRACAALRILYGIICLTDRRDPDEADEEEPA